MKHNRKIQGFLKGLVYGLIPHIGCIAFIIFSILGVTTATAFFKPLLLNPYFFYILISISIAFATMSAIFYFKKQGFISLSKVKNGLEISFLPKGLKRKWKYLLTLYGTTVFINLILFMIIFPIAANVSPGLSLKAALIDAFGSGEQSQLSDSGSFITLQVKIPCPGHAPLITGELKTISGVDNVKFKFPNVFNVGYDPEKTSKQEILLLDVFKTYGAVVLGENAGETGSAELAGNIGKSQPLINAGSCCGGGGGGGVGGGGGGCGCGSSSCGK